MNNIDLRYVQTRSCELNCPGCYLKEWEREIPNQETRKNITIEDGSDSNITFYLNAMDSEQTMKQFQGFSSWMRQLQESNRHKKPTSLTFITDVQTYRRFRKEILSVSLMPYFQHLKDKTLSLSIRNREDLQERNLIKPDNSSGITNIVYTFVHGLDHPVIWKDLSNLMLEDKVKTSFMFSKPATFNPDVLSFLSDLRKKYGNSLVYIDMCFFKAVDQFDCTKNQEGNHKYSPVFTIVGKDEVFPCTYPTNSCQVMIGNSSETPRGWNYYTKKNIEEKLYGG